MIFRKPSINPILLCSCVLMAGCASSSDRYPSLAIRDVERASGTFYPASPAEATPAAVGRETLSRIEQLVADAKLAHGEFQATAPSARIAVESAIGSGPEANQWAIAQVSLADLDSHRSLAAIALGDLDLLYSGATLEFTDREQIDAARDVVAAMIAEEDAILAGLRGKLGS